MACEQGSRAHFVFDRHVLFRSLVQMTCNCDVTLCMITKFMNKWMFTFCKYNCSFFIVFTLCKALSYSTGHMQISNDAAQYGRWCIQRLPRTLSSTSPRDPSDVGMVKSHVAVPHLHHLTHLSTWSNYWCHGAECQQP
jgi:hypothetical protein